MQQRVLLLGWQMRRQLGLQPNGALVFQEVEGVAVGRASTVVILPRPLPFSILKSRRVTCPSTVFTSGGSTPARKYCDQIRSALPFLPRPPQKRPRSSSSSTCAWCRVSGPGNCSRGAPTARCSCSTHAW